MMKWDRDLMMSHYNTIVSLLCNNDSVMNVMELIADEDDIPRIQNYLIDLRNIFNNTSNWSGVTLLFTLGKNSTFRDSSQLQSLPADFFLIC